MVFGWRLLGRIGNPRLPDTRRHDAFFPATNQDDFNSPGVCGESSENVPVKDLRAYTKGVIDSVTDLAVQVDGHYANDLIQRVKSIVYATTLPIDNVFNAICGGPGAVPAGVYLPSVDDGFYVMLKPLKVGQHTIHFMPRVAAASRMLSMP